MKTTLSVLSATALVGAMLLGSVSNADAYWRGRGWGVGPAIVGGAALGVLAGAALASVLLRSGTGLRGPGARHLHGGPGGVVAVLPRLRDAARGGPVLTQRRRRRSPRELG